MAFVRILLGAERRWNALAAALLAAAGILVLVTFADYGVTWDEDVHNWYGVFALDYYLSLFNDQRALNWLNTASLLHDPVIADLKVDPRFDKLRGDARFVKLLETVGLAQ